ncbi:hypothetical protein GCM10019059_24200 [Camelimonas fluminis]|uniref:Uncharacterized protein n=1 Tax=Camelimonas fluminis TaxID=1576911 RepID=A0ABV7UAZ9_9HYPH|nr:hypothetical protein [Camelimonas fluminis]GHE63839.1 hypothetical protein GCM10019059_24200 [Camelimonas fluminis]
MSRTIDEAIERDLLKGKLVLKTVPMTLTKQMEETAVEVYERMLSYGMPVHIAVEAAAHGAIVAAPVIDPAEMRIAPPGAVIVLSDWINSAREAYDRCKLDPIGTPAAKAATLELLKLVDKILPAVPPPDWRGATVPTREDGA